MKKSNKVIVYLTGEKIRKKVVIVLFNHNKVGKTFHSFKKWLGFVSAVLQQTRTREIKIKKPLVLAPMQRWEIQTGKTVKNHYSHLMQSH
jgi:hypothetical protein